MNLNKKLILLITVILITVLSIYSYFIISTMKQQVLDQMRSSAKLLAESLERTIVTSGALNNREVLQRLVLDFNKVDGIDEVYVVDTNYKIIAHPDLEEIGTVYDNEDVRDAIKTGKVATEFKKDDNQDLYDVVIPLNDGGHTVGAIEVELGLGKMNKMIHSVILKAIFAVILTIAILALLLISIMFRVVVKRLENLVQAANQIAAGSFKPIVNDSYDEIGQLISAFNEMVSALQKASERDKSANPLTGLPGNVVIKEELDKYIRDGNAFSVLYVDLDNFKAYNDAYGFEFGDEMIKFTADIIRQAILQQGNPSDFLGHIGGDDFVMISDIGKGEAVAKHITEAFDAEVEKMYRDNHDVRVSISVAHIKVPQGKVNNSLVLGELAAELKKKVKKMPGSNYLTE